MGEVYAAVDDVLGRSVAVKTLRRASNAVGPESLDERFRLEARAIAALNHPGIVQVYDIDLAADPPYLVMERVAGPSLKERLVTGALTASEVRALGIQIARALASAHAAGIVHRDVKPANILAAGAGAWKLADFGVAHVPDSSLTMTGQFIGSPAFAPPEALLRGQSSPAGDVFGLGATLYYAAAGRWPRAEETNVGLLAPIRSLRELVGNFPDDLIATIDQAVAIEPDRRPSASALSDALASGSSPSMAQPMAQPLALHASPAVQTAFVPDASTVGARPPLLAPRLAVDTAFVPDATVDGASARQPANVAASAARPRVRWVPWAIGVAVVAFAIVAVLATRGGKPMAATGSASSPLDPAASAAGSSDAEMPDSESPALPLPPPGQIRAVTPPIHDRRAARDWEKIVDKLYEHEFASAREKLDAYEQRWGESPETRSLRQQLQALPAEALSDD